MDTGSWLLVEFREVGNLLTSLHESAGDGPGGPRKPEEHLSVASEDVRKQAEQLLNDPLFQKSHRYSNLLKFIVDRTLKGQNQDLKERIIGIEVFGRTPDYDTSLDPTVRVAAAELRKRLIKYYSRAEHERELRIELPVRSYVAEFKPPEHDAPELLLVPAKKKPKWTAWYLWGPAAMVGIALAAWAAVGLFYPVSAVDRFWAPVLTGPGPLLLCISSAGPESSTAPAASTPSAGSGSQPLPPGQAAAQDANIAVGMLDVNAINKISVYLRRKGKDFVVRAAQAISLADLRSGPAVLYGSYHNEWSHLLENNLSFQFRDEKSPGLRWIEDNNNPASRKWSIGVSVAYEQVNSDYALITRAQDPNTGQWWIGIGGLTGQATLAANQLLLDPSAMSRLTAGLPEGWDKKNLQMVLEINVIHGSPGVPRVVATYTW